MRFGVFRLATKTAKEAEVADVVKVTYRLVYRDGLGNQLTVAGTEDDYKALELGDALPWESVVRQSTLP
ncbi:MAG: hypothetical protein CEE41_04300 [Hadesarchaea archaeon B3_Hades]|nr:MAG: hypothetical protein CEE41_04300 [Hadesarchaea archaeon B3_Hades]